jgi:predicted DNA-binding protein (UPF0251 family)
MRSSPELFTPSLYLTDIITLPVINPSKEISSLLVDYEEKGLSLRQIAAKKVHSRSTISEILKEAGVKVRAPCQGHGNPSQLRFGYRKDLGRVVPHKGEQQIIEALKDFRTEGLTFRQIAQRMTALRIPSKNGKFKWHPMMVKRALSS